MYPSLQRANSTVSFVTHTTKHIQTDPPKPKDLKKKEFRAVEKRSVAVDPLSPMKKPEKSRKETDRSDSFKPLKTEVVRSELELKG